MDASDAQTFSPSGFSFSNPTFWNIVLAVALLVFGLLLIDVKAEGLFYTWDHQIAARFSTIESSLSATQDAFVRVVGKLGSNGTAVLAILWLLFG